VHRSAIVTAYLHAKETLLATGYSEAIDWQQQVTLRSTTESNFLREAAWVVLSAGMQARVIETKFPELRAAFLEFSSGEAITHARTECRTHALHAFRHVGKIDAILEIASRVHRMTWDSVKSKLMSDGPTYLETLPYIGPVTALHLAKNIGMDVPKSDRHLVRLAQHVGASDVTALCNSIASAVGDRVGVVDLVLWRYVALYGVGSLTDPPEFCEQFLECTPPTRTRG
jgi:hypothetical protein